MQCAVWTYNIVIPTRETKENNMKHIEADSNYMDHLEREVARLEAINMQLEEKLAAVKEQRDFARQQLISKRL